MPVAPGTVPVTEIGVVTPFWMKLPFRLTAPVEKLSVPVMLPVPTTTRVARPSLTLTVPETDPLLCAVALTVTVLPPPVANVEAKKR